MGLVITFALGVFLLLGVVVVKLAKGSKTIEQLSIAIALGTMVSLVVLELTPEVLETFQGWMLAVAALAVFAGVMALKVLDRFIPDHTLSLPRFAPSLYESDTVASAVLTKNPSPTLTSPSVIYE